MIWQRRFTVSYNPKAQIVSSLDAITRKYRIDPSQYYAETELIIRLCKTHGIKMLPLNETGHLKEAYLPNRFTRLYTKEIKLGVPMIGTSSMLNLRLPQDMRIFLRNIRNADKLYINDGDILVSRSGTVGTCVLCGKSYKGFVASDDCIRLRISSDLQGYVAAYLKSQYGHALITRDAHGKVIKHLKPDDLENLQIMMFDEKSVTEINDQMLRSKNLYDDSRQLLSEIDSLLDECLGHIIPELQPESNYNIIAATALRMNRLDPHMYDSYSNYLLTEIVRYGSIPLEDIAVPWVVPRFKRNYLDEKNPNAAPLFSSSDIVRANFSASKFISKKLNARNISLCKVEKDYILIPCSGAYGGILGKGILAGTLLDGKAMSQHVLRIKERPDNKSMDFFYVAAFLCSYKFGYPLITATRFGKDIPELDPEALKSIPIPNIPQELQVRIGTMFKAARSLQEEANSFENAAISAIERLYENTASSN